MSEATHAVPALPARLDRQHLGYAWLALTLAFAIHIIEEADHDFVAIYQPLTAALNERLPILTLPNIAFTLWLAALAAVVVALLALSPLAFRGGRWIRRTAYVYAALMAANAIVHFVSMLQVVNVQPGSWTAMLLLVTAAMLFVAARRVTPGHHLPFES